MENSKKIFTVGAVAILIGYIILFFFSYDLLKSSILWGLFFILFLIMYTVAFLKEIDFTKIGYKLSIILNFFVIELMWGVSVFIPKKDNYASPGMGIGIVAIQILIAFFALLSLFCLAISLKTSLRKPKKVTPLWVHILLWLLLVLVGWFLSFRDSIWLSVTLIFMILFLLWILKDRKKM